jgi:histidinol-phosphate phosphatase family protein
VDRDGVINAKAPEGDYVKSWSEFTFLPGALDGLRLLRDAGLRVILVTNQRGIARGRMTLADVDDIHARLRDAAEGAITGVYLCPHEGGCRCRKPATGMFEDAARDFGLDLSRTALIGDRRSDMEAARAIGAMPIFIRGYAEDPGPVAFEVDGLLEAARRLTSSASSAA